MQDASQLDVPVWGFIVALLGVVLSAGGFVWQAFSRAHGRIDAQDRRIGELEAALGALPTQAQVSRLNERLAEVQAAVRAQESDIRSTRETVDWMRSFLLQHMGKGS